MFCPSCGASVIDGMAFCSNCGSSINQNAVDQSQSTFQAKEDYPTEVIGEANSYYSTEDIEPVENYQSTEPIYNQAPVYQNAPTYNQAPVYQNRPTYNQAPPTYNPYQSAPSYNQAPPVYNQYRTPEYTPTSYGAPTTPRRMNGGKVPGILSLIFGIVGYPTLICYGLGLALWFAAFILGIVGISVSKKNGYSNGRAVAGLILSLIPIFLCVLGAFFALAVMLLENM